MSEEKKEKKELAELTLDETIEALAAANYGPSDIALYIGHNRKSFLTEWNNPESKIRYHYNRGRLKASFEVDTNMQQNAAAGNITAAQIFYKRVEEQKVADLKHKIFYGYEADEK